MRWKSIYTYAWDLAERGVAEAAAEFRDLGLNTVTMAGSYHAGKFLRPRGTGGKVYFPEDGTVYFRHDLAKYGAIQPAPNSLLGQSDPLREVCETDLAANVWLVLMHNSRLGAEHPEATVRNAFGDSYIYNLCPSSPDARAYALGLAKDVTTSYPVAGISVESPGFLPYAHGYHHEFAMVRANRWLDAQLGLCFCPHCLAGAAKAGIDAKALKAQVAGDIETYLSGDAEYPDDMAEAFWLADAVTDRELSAFLAWRCTVVTSLIAEIRAEVRADAEVAVIPSVARPTGGAWYEGSDLKALAEAAGIVEACFYEPSSDRVAADLADIQRRLRGAGRLRGILRPAHPDLSDPGDLVAAVQALAAGGLDGLSFYNWGFLRPQNLRALGCALRTVA